MRYQPPNRFAGPTLESLEPRQLFAADPVTPDNPLWIIPIGAATVIDGLLNEPAWDSAGTVFRTQATRSDRAVTVRMMYGAAGVYLGVDVQDFNIWADGIGGGTGNRWEVEQDDSITFYFDPDGSRDEFFQANDRAFGVNLGKPTDPINRSDGGTVHRWKYVKGDGLGGAPDAIPGGALVAGMYYASTIRGTVNNPSDTDRGWTVEMFIPWAGLSMSVPTSGQTIGMNFDMIQDNDGGTRNLTSNRDNPDPNIQYLLPHFIDDHVQGSQSSYAATQAGLHGPVNYAEAMFIDAGAGLRPATITDAQVSNIGAFGAMLSFTAPAGTTTGRGFVSGYDIRVSTSPIATDADWLGATPIQNSFVPRLRGLAESLRIAPLDPATTYFLAVRGVDGAGNPGALSSSLSFTTLAAAGAGDRGRIIPSPMGSTFMYEDGTPFVVVGDHLGLTWGYTRQLFPGDVWDNSMHIYQNFALNTPGEGPYGPYLDMVRAKGVNTMRVYLELQNVYFQGNPSPPRGLNWLENNAGQFNPDMHAFVTNVLREASLRGMKIIFSPFDDFSYDEAFGQEGPWATNFGGPLTDINNFFQTTATSAVARNRMQAVIDWVNQGPYASTLIGWEPLSEWDTYEWTLNPEGNAEPGRETEFRRRAVWIEDLARYIRFADPAHLVLQSTVTRDPRGPVAREVFYSRTFDALTPHLYTNANQSPLLNPQADKSALAAMEAGYFTSYFITNRIDNRPVLDGEWGMTRAAWPNNLPQYGPGFTQQQDEYLYRAVIWSSFASGQPGTALRIVADELSWNLYLLTPTMRDTELTFSRFVNSSSLQMDFSHFALRNLAGRIDAAAAGHTLLSWGVTDGLQGVAYVLRDGNLSSGTVSGATLTIGGLMLDRIVDAEVWSTLPGSTAPLATISGLYSNMGSITLALPDFAQDVAVKFRARARTPRTQHLVSKDVGAQIVTFGLGIDQQPFAYSVSAATGAAVTLDIGLLANFRERVVDMTPFTTSDGLVHLAITDSRAHLWFLSGDLSGQPWSALDLTAMIGAPGLAGDLTTYQPSWGAMCLASVDARGHAINYWWSPGLPTWQYTDMTGLYGGPTLKGGLTGFVTGWDGLTLAGLNEAGQVVIYWWAPGIAAFNGGDPNKWLTQNMTTDLTGPTFVGQLDAFVTSWGGLNIVGRTADGKVCMYWWTPQLKADNLAAGRPDLWAIADLTSAAGAPPMANGVGVGFSTDGGINAFATDSASHLHMFRWVPGTNWAQTDVSVAAAGPTIDLPLASASAGSRLTVAGRTAGAPHRLVVFSFLLATQTWQTNLTTLLVT